MAARGPNAGEKSLREILDETEPIDSSEETEETDDQEA